MQNIKRRDRKWKDGNILLLRKRDCGVAAGNDQIVAAGDDLVDFVHSHQLDGGINGFLIFWNIKNLTGFIHKFRVWYDN